jgi:alanine racemase
MVSIQYNINDIAQIVKGEFLSKSTKNSVIRDVMVDSRKLISPEQCIFFALVGKRNDGHDYIDELYRKGIRNFVISNISVKFEDYKDVNVIKVDNSLKALQALTSAHRRKFDIPVIGITGSNGKTIVKEWLFQLMHKDKKIIRSPKSYNSQIGVPLSVWQMEPSNELGIFEAGISEPDEMDKLQSIIQPTIGIFTNIGQAHDQGFISTVQKAGEKLKLFTKVDTLIYCSDHPDIREIIIKSEILNSIKTFTWSTKQESNLTIINILRDDINKTTIIGIYDQKEISITIPFVDNASVENAIHCWATMLYFGYSNEVIRKRMTGLQPIAMRLELKEGINYCTIINDSYNSDINSLTIAIDFLNQQSQHKKKTIILSDILQSGKDDDELYSEIADILQIKGIDRIIGVGPSISRYAYKFGIEKLFFNSTGEFLQKFPFSLFSNESILLKGARVFEFEQINKSLQQKSHETVLEINLNAMVHNLNYYRSKMKPITKVMAMVKAFSYGSGSYEIANTLQFHRIDYLAVAYVDEGVDLRKAGIIVPIMVMNPEEQSFDVMFKHNLEPEIYSIRILKSLEKAIRKNILPENKPVKIHIKIDTGMHRLGFEEKEVDNLIQRLKANKQIYVQSVFSHLAASEDPAHDEFTRMQIERFITICKHINSVADHPVIYHILNSAGISRFPDAQFNMVRLGISLYGIAHNNKEQKNLQNVSTLKSTISQIKLVPAKDTIGYNRRGVAKKELKIAIVPVGYADGLNRKLSNGVGKLLIKGKNAPIIGNICMDMCIVDITGIDANEGDEVIIFGKEKPINKLAEKLDTISYEILAGISRRVKRVYFHE